MAAAERQTMGGRQEQPGSRAPASVAMSAANSRTGAWQPSASPRERPVRGDDLGQLVPGHPEWEQRREGQRTREGDEPGTTTEEVS
jgi:hypothetical protein